MIGGVIFSIRLLSMASYSSHLLNCFIAGPCFVPNESIMNIFVLYLGPVQHPHGLSDVNIGNAFTLRRPMQALEAHARP